MTFIPYFLNKKEQNGRTASAGGLLKNGTTEACSFYNVIQLFCKSLFTLVHEVLAEQCYLNLKIAQVQHKRFNGSQYECVVDRTGSNIGSRECLNSTL